MMHFALIENGIVANIALFHQYFVAQKTAEDLGYIAVDVTNMPIEIGDTYEDGSFYRNGELVMPLKEEHTAQFVDIAPLEEAIAAIDARLKDTEDESVMVMLALVDIYEQSLK